MQSVANQFENPVAGGMPPIPTSQSMEVEESVKLKPRFEIKRDIPRYVVQAGDLLPEATKRNWKGVHGYQVGGMHFDLTEIPCLWRFSGFITRGRITPLIKKPVIAFQAEEIVKKKAEQIAEIVDRGGTVTESSEVRRTAFPWDSLQSLLSDHNGRKGIVEVTALEGVEWELRIAQELQMFFFPNWADIEAGKASIPFTVREFVAHIESRLRESSEPVIQSVGDAYLESAGKFKVYAEEVVQKTKDLAQRGALESGYVMPISALARHLAAQVEMNIEAKQTVVIQGGGTSSANPNPRISDAEIELRNRELAIEEEKLRIERIKLGLEPANSAGDSKPVEKPVTVKGQSMESEEVPLESANKYSEGTVTTNQFSDENPSTDNTTGSGKGSKSDKK